MLSLFDRISESVEQTDSPTDGQTDGRTDRISASRSRVSVMTRDKN